MSRVSKFIDKLNSISSGGLAPMGFRAGGTKPRPRVVLVAHGTKAASGADALLLTVSKSGIKAPKAGVPWGGWLKEVIAPTIKKLGEGGADFVVFPAASISSAMLENDKLSKVVEVEPDIESSLLKSVDGLPVDAVLIKGEKPSLTWRDLMLLRRAAGILNKPLLVTVSPDITASELGALCQAGVGGVVASSKIDKLRQMIDKLPAPKAGKSRAEPLVPRVGGSAGTVPEEEDED
jgi:hypothetical protein